MTQLSPSLQAVVELFAGPLAGVRFADIDAQGLTNLATEVAVAAAEVEQHEAKLVELRQGLAQRQEALVALAQQALAYARIYAENDEPLLARLNDIALPRATKPRKPAIAKSSSSGGAEAPQEAAAALAAEVPALTAGNEPSDEAAEEATKTKPSYARPKVKRRLGRASQTDSA